MTGSRLKVAALVVAILGLSSSLAFAQSAIAGVARDTSGAVLPGVTVEVASDALIEKVRSATTDGEGRYNIVDLRPGVFRFGRRWKRTGGAFAGCRLDTWLKRR